MPGDSLFATTALVASAGVASAQGITFDGAAEMGYSGGGAGIEEGFHQTFDLGINFSGETDNGLTFGADIDLEDALDEAVAGRDTADTVNTNPDFRVFISGAFGNLTMGDTDGALDFVNQETNTAGSPGSLGDGETEHPGYIGAYLDGSGSGQILRYDNTFGDFTFAASVEQNAANTTNGNVGYAIGFGYTLGLAAGSVTFGLGYQEAAGVNNGSTIDGSAALALDSGFEATLRLGQFEGDVANTDAFSWGLGLGYAFGPFAVHANYGHIDNDVGLDNEGYGLAASYDLGGGAGLHLGYGTGNGGFEDRYSFGLAMSF
ncbi:MAG: porin [Rhodobacteraceae bacterium]|nr:porin [Paracoccaceae bacterium]